MEPNVGSNGLTERIAALERRVAQLEANEEIMKSLLDRAVDLLEKATDLSSRGFKAVADFMGRWHEPQQDRPT